MNVMNNVVNKLVEMGTRTGEKFREIGKEPYGMVKSTKQEQREQLKGLTPDVLMKLTRQYGAEAVDKKLRGLVK